MFYLYTVLYHIECHVLNAKHSIRKALENDHVTVVYGYRVCTERWNACRSCTVLYGTETDVWWACEDRLISTSQGPQLRSVVPPCWQSRSPTPGLCLRFPSSVSPHGAPSNSPQQENMRERGKMRVGSLMEGDKLTCGVLWGECPTSRPLITIR